MKPFLLLEEINNDHRQLIGGKAFALARLHQNGFRVPKTFLIPSYVYNTFVSSAGLRDTIFLEINRKIFPQMRWEEIWDVSLRIRSLFLNTPLPEDIRRELTFGINTHCGDYPVAVRSSAPGEDDAATSFAGIHDSFLNITGTDNILKHIKLVWASLFSDSALLYRKEMGLDISTSTMAVILQELISSQKSGVFFSVNPSDPGQSVLESVHGLNQGLVDGDIEPDRWILHRDSGNILEHTEPNRTQFAVPSGGGVSILSLPESLGKKPPLKQKEIQEIERAGKDAEALFGRPQDMEWSYDSDRLTILQSRPITSSGFKDTDDKRSWYLSLHRSFENLKKLHRRINNQLIPEMIRLADEMGRTSLAGMTNPLLALEIQKRQDIYDHWTRVYWNEFIPFAHGIRLFGQVYNDALRPKDPYEFMQLLEGTGLKSIERNRFLEKLAAMIQTDGDLEKQLTSGETIKGTHPFMVLLEQLIAQFGDLACQTSGGAECFQGHAALIRLIVEFSHGPIKTPSNRTRNDIETLKKRFVESFSKEKQSFAQEVLHLGRESYRLRDDDNIHLGRLETRLFEAVQQGQSRLANPESNPGGIEDLSALPVLSTPASGQKPSRNKEAEAESSDLWVRARQIVGHPAGPGIAQGPARVIQNPGDLLNFKQGEVLICQSVDPNMTFVVPLCSAVVEERGGMLIHGAIIAREYGLPCVTGASGIIQLIQTGDRVTVDGYLGIVTCDTGEL